AGKDVVGAAPPQGPQVPVVSVHAVLDGPGGAVVGAVQDVAASAHHEDVVGAGPPHVVEAVRVSQDLGRPRLAVVAGVQNDCDVGVPGEDVVRADGEDVVGAA